MNYKELLFDTVSSVDLTLCSSEFEKIAYVYSTLSNNNTIREVVDVVKINFFKFCWFAITFRHTTKMTRNYFIENLEDIIIYCNGMYVNNNFISVYDDIRINYHSLEKVSKIENKNEILKFLKIKKYQLIYITDYELASFLFPDDLIITIDLYTNNTKDLIKLVNTILEGKFVVLTFSYTKLSINYDIINSIFGYIKKYTTVGVGVGVGAGTSIEILVIKYYEDYPISRLYSSLLTDIIQHAQTPIEIIYLFKKVFGNVSTNANFSTLNIFYYRLSKDLIMTPTNEEYRCPNEEPILNILHEIYRSFDEVYFKNYYLKTENIKINDIPGLYIPSITDINKLYAHASTITTKSNLHCLFFSGIIPNSIFNKVYVVEINTIYVIHDNNDMLEYVRLFESMAEFSYDENLFIILGTTSTKKFNVTADSELELINNRRCSARKIPRLNIELHFGYFTDTRPKTSSPLLSLNISSGLSTNTRLSSGLISGLGTSFI